MICIFYKIFQDEVRINVELQRAIVFDYGITVILINDVLTLQSVTEKLGETICEYMRGKKL